MQSATKSHSSSRHSHWRNGSRAYSIELCQDLFAYWQVITRWGKYGSRGGQERQSVFTSRKDGEHFYEKQCAIRQKRGYSCRAQS